MLSSLNATQGGLFEANFKRKAYSRCDNRKHILFGFLKDLLYCRSLAFLTASYFYFYQNIKLCCYNKNT